VVVHTSKFVLNVDIFINIKFNISKAFIIIAYSTFRTSGI